jgi:RNA polymerase primary sigma factor
VGKDNNDETVLPPADDDQIVDASGGPLSDIDEPALDELVDEEEEDIDTLNSGQYFDDVSDDSVRLYLREIGKIPLLNAEEELTLARRIKLGSILEELRGDIPPKKTTNVALKDDNNG